MTSTHNPAHLLPPSWRATVHAWLADDMPDFDYGGYVVGEAPSVGALWCKSPGVLAGVPFATEVFRHLDCTVDWHVAEGTFVDPTTEPAGKVRVATVRGAARNLLMAERTALNLMARCAGIASRARALVQLKEKHGFKGAIAGTRKTTPGFRLVEKYALHVGGVDPHRYSLSSMIMLKDNHIWSTGSITNAVRAAKTAGGFALKVEVECQSEAEAVEAIEAGADIVMLDNYTPREMKVQAASLKKRWPHVLVEASGGITIESVADWFDDSIDVISMGSLTQGVPFVDYSLKIVKGEQ
ncbi:nicotinate-nucleotide pyrophosphorylase [Blastocladiella britannica]|nr:nicotinate-nucleotide pyrophosphorylase [Blastocladiella britannica]